MISSTEPVKPWGTYIPSGTKKALTYIIRLGLSHGVIKKFIQKLWFSGNENIPVDINYEGVKFRLQPWDNVVERKMLFGSRRRDLEEIEFLKSHLDDNSVFFDIGANIGYYACVLAASGVRHIVAVEPHPVTQTRLKFNIETNRFQDRISVAPFALGSSAGEVVLTAPGGDLGSSSICIPCNDTNIARYTVQMLSLYELCRKLNVSRIDAAKIDVEGLEDKVFIPFFEEAPRALWPRYIVLEHAHSHEWEDDLFSKMGQCGYRACIQTRSNTIYELLTPKEASEGITP